MLGAVTTLMMHFPVGSMIDALFFILKGYRLDGPPRPSVTRLNVGVAKTVTRYLVVDGLLSICKALLMVVVFVFFVRHND